MNKTGVFFFGAMLSVGSLLFAGVGCGGGDTGGTGGAGGGGTGGESTTTGGDTTTTTTGGAAAPTCASYCAAIAANCTGDTAQYAGPESCAAVCAAFPEGTAADTSGNTLGCHAYHADAAKTDAAKHCPHAGPTGGDQDVTDTNPGVCGEGCDAFCKLALKACTSANEVYADEATCLAECKTFKPSAATYSTADTATNDFGCRMYHLSVAATSGDLAGTHCPHIKAVSEKCTN